MMTQIFAVYDSKACYFGTPFFMPSTGAAVRMFSDLANDARSMVNRHPSDFVLYCIGNFDDNSGMVIATSPHISLGLGADFVVPKRVTAPELADMMPALREALVPNVDSNGGKV